MTTAHARLRVAACRGRCVPAARCPEHHDRLLAVDSDPEALLELFEIAVTWHELDYSEARVVGPGEWLDFVEGHHWRHPDRAERAFGLAVDIVGRGRLAPVAPAPLAEVIELVRG